MSYRPSRRARPVARRLKAMFEPLIGWIAVAALQMFRRIDRRRAANMLGRLMRTIGPWLPEHRTGRANLVAAFPDKPAVEIDAILSGVWDNLGRVAAEFAHIDRINTQHPDRPGTADVTHDPITYERYLQIRKHGKPVLYFAAHLANWEIPALAPPVFGIDACVLYRRPNIRAVSDAIGKMRATCMGTLIPAGIDAPFRLARALERGIHVGMLVDQYLVQGIEVTFFGRPCRTNPLLAQLARQFEYPIHGVRVVRRPDGHTFWGELTDPIAPPRDREGRIDIHGTMQAVTSVVEGWVREHPEQWLWLHRRWR